MDENDLVALLGRQRAAHLRDGPPSAELRIDRIDRCISLIKENADALEHALSQDFGNRSLHASGLTDVMTPVAALAHARKHLKAWMKPEKRRVDPPILALFGARAEIRFQPKGVIGIVSPWNFPVGLVFSPLAGVLAAGNRAIIKPSEFTPRTSELMQNLIRNRFAEDEVAVVLGDARVGADFTRLPFDHLVFTGAGSIARHVMRAAAENLVPVTLELGGKSPVVISRKVNMPVAAARIMAGKVLNAGQICLAPDHVFVPAEQRDAFVSAAKNAVATMLPTLRDNPDYTAIISERHYDRIRGYVEDAREKGGTIVEINPACENFAQQEHRKIPPTLILDATRDMAVMQDEIFGPVLPIMTYDRLNTVSAEVNQHDRPLALYYFGKDEGELNELMASTTTGGVCVNDVIMHCAQENLPFGGIGPSGTGVYHGRDGFIEFSHRKAVYRQIRPDLTPLKLLRPPYGDKVRKLVSATMKGYAG